MSSIGLDARFDALLTLFIQDAEDAARRTGCVQRLRCFSGATLVRTLVFGFLHHPRATLTNLVEPVGLTWNGGTDLVARAESRVLPAALEEVTVVPDGLGYILVCYVPNVADDIVRPLKEAGYGDEEIAVLGETRG